MNEVTLAMTIVATMDVMYLYDQSDEYHQCKLKLLMITESVALHFFLELVFLL